MTLEEIMAFANVTSRNTVKGWMRHLGMPRPVRGGTKGKPFEWDGPAFYAWWGEHGPKVGRHPKERQKDLFDE